MVNPTMIKKAGNSLALTENTKKLFQIIYQEQRKEEKNEDEEAKIKVSELVSKMAFYYEKIRNTVDYEEEHLLRKNAIERILHRQIVIEGVIPSRKHLQSEEISKHLLTELIRAGYLPNNNIPETRIGEVGVIIDKYLKLKDYHAEQAPSSYAEKNDLTGWLIALAASEIEEKLGRSRSDLAVIGQMYEVLLKNIRLADNSPFEADKKVQIYVGVYRNYLKFDRDMLSFILFKYYNTDWQSPGEDDLRAIAVNIASLRERIDRQLDHPLAGQLNRIISRYTVFFTTLTDVIEENPVSVYEGLRSSPDTFIQRIKKICNKRYAFARSKLWRAAVRSIIYIFITKSVFAVMIEVPASRWFGQGLNDFALAVNISFPAILLFVIVLFTKLPGEDNTKKITEGIEEIIYVERERKDPFYVRASVKRGKILNTVFGFIYAITFFVSFGIVIWALGKLQFSWVSTTIFLFFLAFVSFFSIRIRKNPRELLITPPKENIFNLLADFFYVPIVAAGKWMSEKFSRINIFVFVLDFIIEAPFKILVEVTEEWAKYVKERKDEIV